MKIKNGLPFITCLVFLACKNNNRSNDTPIQPDREKAAVVSKDPSLSHLDTTIVLTITKDGYLSNKALPEKNAKALLYQYFERKGIKPRNATRDTSLTTGGKLCVEYDTIYPLQTSKYSGAIVSYWLGPADLNGHCFQPSKAFILHTREGYRITSEEFIPTHYVIDSVIKSTMYGYDYECGGRGITRYLKVTLE